MGALLWLCGLCACTSTNTAPLAAASAEVGPGGGSVIASDGTTVDVPPNALAATALLTLTPAPNALAPDGLSFVSTAWTLEPPTVSFAQPITITFPVDPAGLGPDASVGDLLIISEGDAGVVALASTPRDATHVMALTSGFATGAPVVVSCPLQCARTSDATGQRVSCAATCIGRSYTLTCDGPVATAACSCALDGVVTSIFHADVTGDTAGPRAYSALCRFPSTSVTAVAFDAGSDGS
ncbi:MAG: hypothetical protein ACHREM_28615 [Polyangiales bacterium]